MTVIKRVKNIFVTTVLMAAALTANVIAGDFAYSGEGAHSASMPVTVQVENTKGIYRYAFSRTFDEVFLGYLEREINPEQLKTDVADSSDIEAVNNGKTFTFDVNVDYIADIKDLKAAYPDIRISDGFEYIALDISAQKVISDNRDGTGNPVATTLSQTGQPIEYLFDIPTYDATKQYLKVLPSFAYRIHNGRVDQIPVTIDETMGKYRFVTDKFSEFIIPYDLVDIYTLEVKTDSHGTAKASKYQGIAGESIILTATAGKGYSFNKWEATTGEVKIATSNPATFTFSDSNAAVTASFNEIPKYNITVSASTVGGTCSANYSQAYAGTPITLTAIPNNGYAFKGWTTTGVKLSSATSTTAVFSMPEGHVAATGAFEPIPEYSITIKADGNGTASASTYSSEAGKKVSLNANPLDGYDFEKWVVEKGGVTLLNEKKPDTSFTMPARGVVLKATFKKQTTPTSTPTPTVTSSTSKSSNRIPSIPYWYFYQGSPGGSSDEGDNSSSGSGGGGGAYYVNVVFRDWNGIELMKVTVPQGSKIDPPANPQSFIMNGYVYTFIGWYGDIGGVFDGTARGYETFKAQYYAQVAGTTGETTGDQSATGSTTGSTGPSTGSAKSGGSTANSTSSKTSGPAEKSKTSADTNEADEEIGTPKSSKDNTNGVTNEEMAERLARSQAAQDEARKRFTPYEYYRSIPGAMEKFDSSARALVNEKMNTGDYPEYPYDTVGRVNKDTKVLSANDYSDEQLTELGSNTLYEDDASDEEIAVAQALADESAMADTTSEEDREGFPWTYAFVIGGILLIGVIVFIIWHKHNRDEEEED